MSKLIRVTVIAGFVAVAGFIVYGQPAVSQDIEDGENWRVTLDTPHYGNLEGVFTTHHAGRNLFFNSTSVLTSDIAALPSEGTWFPEGYAISMRLRRARDGSYSGRMASLSGTFRSGHIETNLHFEGSNLTGEIQPGSPFSGHLVGRRIEGAGEPLRDYSAINGNLHNMIRDHLYNPGLLNEPGMADTLGLQMDYGNRAIDDFDFILTYAFTRVRLPFSHFEVLRPAGGYEGLMSQRNNVGAEDDVVQLRFEDQIAILTVNSFVGQQVPAQITAAFSEIVASGADSLIIDLRRNGGGSLAGAALANHVLPEGRPIGYFVSNGWWSANTNLPTAQDTEGLSPFTGLTLDDFYDAIESNGLVRVDVTPSETQFDGQLYVLSSSSSTSMSELVLNAFKQTGRGTIIGEATPGQMLSSKFYDIGGGFVVRIPVADYYSWTGERIEGVGVTPDVVVQAEDALETALELARSAP